MKMLVASRPDVLMSTGRSDYPNQINNVIGSLTFSVSLLMHAKAINEEMKSIAIIAATNLARTEVPMLSAMFIAVRFNFPVRNISSRNLWIRLITEVSAAGKSSYR